MNFICDSNFTTENILQVAKTWFPSYKDRRSGIDHQPPEYVSTVKILKRMISILNKLNESNFFELRQQFLRLNLKLKKEQEIDLVIQLIHEKAIDEPKFLVHYVRLVKTVCLWYKEARGVIRNQILDRCHNELEKLQSDPDPLAAGQVENEDVDDDGWHEDERCLFDPELEEKKKETSLGNILLMGQLYKSQLLTSQNMIDSIKFLMKNETELSYDCLCKLLTIIGEKLDHHLKNLSIDL